MFSGLHFGQWHKGIFLFFMKIFLIALKSLSLLLISVTLNGIPLSLGFFSKILSITKYWDVIMSILHNYEKTTT